MLLSIHNIHSHHHHQHQWVLWIEIYLYEAPLSLFVASMLMILSVEMTWMSLMERMWRIWMILWKFGHESWVLGMKVNLLLVQILSLDVELPGTKLYHNVNYTSISLLSLMFKQSVPNSSTRLTFECINYLQTSNYLTEILLIISKKINIMQLKKKSTSYSSQKC